MHAAFHNVTAMVGAGVLGLPNAMVSFWRTSRAFYQPFIQLQALPAPQACVDSNAVFHIYTLPKTSLPLAGILDLVSWNPPDAYCMAGHCVWALAAH